MSTSKNGFMELDLLRLSPKKWAYFQDGRIKRSTSVNPWRWTFMKHSPLKMGSILLTHNSPLPFDYIKENANPKQHTSPTLAVQPPLTVPHRAASLRLT
jgi:hypothetical protein